jgi:CDGSH-type Zn-finger protein
VLSSNIPNVLPSVAPIPSQLSAIASQLLAILPRFAIVAASNVLSHFALVRADLATISADFSIILPYLATIGFRRVVLSAEVHERMASARCLRLCRAGESGNHSSGDGRRSHRSIQHSASRWLMQLVAARRFNRLDV